jgi:hypothetical protein
MELVSPTLWELNLDNVKVACFDATSSVSWNGLRLLKFVWYRF